MKKIFSAIIATVLLAVCNLAKAQDTPAATSDTLYVNFLEDLDKGDILPFKHIYQRAKIWKDTTITSSVSKDITFEVLENDKERQLVILRVTQENVVKQGPECNDPKYMSGTFLLGDGFPLEIIVTYNGDVGGDIYDTLVSRAVKNLDYVADTLANSTFVKEKLTREEWLDRYSYMKDTSFVMWRAVSDFEDLFFFGAYDYEPDSAYTHVDSVFCSSIDEMYYYAQNFGWDKTFSDNNEAFKNMYVFRSMYRFDGIPFLERLYDPISLTKEDIDLLLEKADQKRLIHVMEMTELADRGMGIPILLDKTSLDGYYNEVGDDYMKLTKEVLALDIVKLMSQGGNDDDEEEDDSEPRYDDYGFIKVK
ncbi:MAG: hypothetical protein IJK74_04840 [Bacteroidales bacterium]|nr:hypothetical protein [Bacteroidales bacterium]